MSSRNGFPGGGCESFGGLPSEALTPLTPLSRGERGEQDQKKNQSFSLLSLWEKRAGVVRVSEGTTAALALVLLTALACGKQGPPAPPLRAVPAPTRDLSVVQQGPRLLLSFGYPQTTPAGTALGGILAVEIWEASRPAPEGKASPLDPREFNAAAKLLQKLAGADLTTATDGGRIIVLLPLPETRGRRGPGSPVLRRAHVRQERRPVGPLERGDARAQGAAAGARPCHRHRSRRWRAGRVVSRRGSHGRVQRLSPGLSGARPRAADPHRRNPGNELARHHRPVRRELHLHRDRPGPAGADRRERHHERARGALSRPLRAARPGRFGGLGRRGPGAPGMAGQRGGRPRRLHRLPPRPARAAPSSVSPLSRWRPPSLSIPRSVPARATATA